MIACMVNDKVRLRTDGEIGLHNTITHPKAIGIEMNVIAICENGEIAVEFTYFDGCKCVWNRLSPIQIEKIQMDLIFG